MTQLKLPCLLQLWSAVGFLPASITADPTRKLVRAQVAYRREEKGTKMLTHRTPHAGHLLDRFLSDLRVQRGFLFCFKFRVILSAGCCPGLRQRADCALGLLLFPLGGLNSREQSGERWEREGNMCLGLWNHADTPWGVEWRHLARGRCRRYTNVRPRSLNKK